MALLHTTGGVGLGEVELVGSAELPQPASSTANPTQTEIRIKVLIPVDVAVVVKP